MNVNSTEHRIAKKSLVSVVLPVFNEVVILTELTKRLVHELQHCAGDYEIIFINDGSSDGSDRALDKIVSQNRKVRVVHFSRNFGHQSAIKAALQFATGDVVISMDSDLQDDPKAIPKFLKSWESGNDVVFAVRTKRKEFWAKRVLFHSFYRLLNFVSATPIPNDAGIFGCLDRKVVDSICQMPESDRFMPGLRSWVGFRQAGIEVERAERHDDHPRVSIYQLFQLAKTAIFSFSRVPLSMFYAIAILSVAVCFCAIGFSLYHKIFTGLAIPGWTSITIVASFFGAVNSFGIGVLGEYVVRIYDQVRGRPAFVVARTTNFENQPASANSNANEAHLLQEIEQLRSHLNLASKQSQSKSAGNPISEKV